MDSRILFTLFYLLGCCYFLCCHCFGGICVCVWFLLFILVVVVLFVFKLGRGGGEGWYLFFIYQGLKSHEVM